jgi:hypothetical protein
MVSLKLFLAFSRVSLFAFVGAYSFLSILSLDVLGVIIR